MISTIGVITLPDDLGNWGERVTDVWIMFKDNPVSGGALVVGLVLVVMANWEKVSRLLGGKRWRSDEELGNELHGWLRRAQYGLQDVTPSPEVNFTFGFAATDPAGRPVTVIKLEREPAVQLQARVIPSPEHEPIIQGMTADQRNALLEDVGLELAKSGLGFDARDLSGTGIAIVGGFIPNPTLTEGQFISQVDRVSRATLVVQVIVSKHIRLANTFTPVMTTATAYTIPE